MYDGRRRPDVSSESRVLYVDADPATTEAVRESLEADGRSVATAVDAEAGLERLEAAEPPGFDCIVSALELPDTDGVEFLHSVRSEYPSVPFVLYPGTGSEAVASEAIAAGVTGYVPRTDGAGHEPLLGAVRGAVEYGSTSPPSQAQEDAVEHSSMGSRPEADDAGSKNASEPSVADAPEDSVEHSSTSPPSPAQEDAGSENASEPSVANAPEDAVETADADRVESLFEYLPTSVVYGEIRPDGPVVERVNPAFEETFGYDASEVVGENLDELIVPEDRQAGAVDINEQLLEGERIRTEVQRLTPDGVRDFRLNVVGREDSDEGYAIYTDVTRSKRRQRRLERQNERLEKFVSVVSHDLRNPLSVAMGNLELADEEHDDPRLADAADAVDRMDALIDDLLTLAREGEHVNEVEAVDLGAVAEDCWEGVGAGAATLETGAAPEIEADRGRVRQLLSNLLRNAVEHSSTSPPSQTREDTGSENASEPSVANAPEDAVEHGSRNVTVTVGDLADGFHVSDDGPGIPESDRDRIFESGFTTDDEGTGFGLSIVAEIVEAHGWEVRATESADGGARFEITGVEVVEGENGGDDGG